MSSIDQLLTDINKSKCLVSSIIQVDMGEWRASIRKVNCMSSGDGSGPTLLAALEDAWDRFVNGDAWSKDRKRRVPPKSLPRKRIRVNRE